MDNYKKLVSNSIIFAIGSLGSKLISFILVPLYTYYLSPTEYGVVDIVVTTSSMILPIISLSIYEAVLRFVMDERDNKKALLSSAFIVTLFGNLLLLLALFISGIFFGKLEIFTYVFFILLSQSVQILFSQYCRAIGKTIIYSMNGILMTLVISVSTIFLLVKLNLGVNGYLIAIILGNIVSVIYLYFRLDLYNEIRLKYYEKHIVNRMLVYCVPMIPNTFMWWLTSSSSRYFLLFYEGAGVTGLYSVANKIPSLISVLSTIFFQAWQISAIEEYESEEKQIFYSNVFDYFSSFMFLSTALLLSQLKGIMGIFSDEYYKAWQYIPFLLIGVIFSGFSSFIATNYMAAKQTNGIFKTSIIGGLLNVIFNFVFVKSYGAIGASIATMLCFIIIFILRYIDTQKYICLTLNYKGNFLNLAIIISQIIILFTNFNPVAEDILLFLLLVLCFLNNIKFIKIIINALKKTFHKIIRR